jgi:hypothetical protein
MARPKKHGLETDGPSRPISFRVSEREYADYAARCAAAGLSISDFFRRVVLTNKTQIVANLEQSSRPDLLRLLFLVNKSSNNINQLARRVNEDHLAGKLEEATYHQILVQLERIAAELKEAVAHAN